MNEEPIIVFKVLHQHNGIKPQGFANKFTLSFLVNLHISAMKRQITQATLFILNHFLKTQINNEHGRPEQEKKNRTPIKETMRACGW